MRVENIPEISQQNAFLAIEDGEALHSVIQRMTRAGEHTVLATSGGRLSGIFTDHDLFDRVVSMQTDTANLRLRDVMTRDVVSASTHEPASDALLRMKENSHHNIPVIDPDGKPAGLLKLDDLAGYADPDLGDVLRKDYEPIMIATAIALYALAVTILLYAF